MLTIRVFLSSPGDVADERRRAADTLRALEESPLLRDRVNLQLVAWDDPGASTPFDARDTPQASVNRWTGRPADCDLTLVILWSRLGTPLPPGLTRADGSRFASGTVWELEDALAADRPVFVYRRTDTPRIELDDPDFEARRAQLQAVRRWFDGLRDGEGTWRAGVNDYKGAAQFQTLLRAHLETFINAHLAAVPAAAEGPAAGARPAPPVAADAAATGAPTVTGLRAPSGPRPAVATAGRSPQRRLWAAGLGLLGLAAVLGWGLWRPGGDRAVSAGKTDAAPAGGAGAQAGAGPAQPPAIDTTPTSPLPALPTVALAAPAEIRFGSMRPTVYTLLGLTPEPGTGGQWRLRVRMRLAAGDNSGGMGFWDSGFRLLVDGVPREPVSTVNLLVEAGTSKDAELLFNLPWAVGQLVLKVWHYQEQGEWPLALRGTRPQAPPSLPAGPRPVLLDGPAEAVFMQSGRTTYTVLAAATENRRPGVFGLRLRVRLQVEGDAESFGNDQFRLLVDGVAQAPDSRLNDLVGARAAKDADITFEVPDGARQLALRIVHRRDASAELPLKLAPRR